MKRIFVFLSFLFIFFSSSAQNKYTISGYIEDIRNGENIFGVNVYSSNNNAGVISNSYGFYSLSLEEGESIVEFSVIGYKNKFYKFDLQKDTVFPPNPPNDSMKSWHNWNAKKLNSVKS